MNKIFYVAMVVTSFVLLGFTTHVKNVIIQSSTPYQKIIESYKAPISTWQAPEIDPGVIWREFEAQEQDTAYFSMQGKAEVILGKMLFFDPRLSKSDQVSCSSCHDPEMGWSDRRMVALGHNHQQGIRNTPSLYNVENRSVFFWDARAQSLEEQAKGPLTAHNEMAMDVNLLADKLSAIPEYKQYFEEVYQDSIITYERILESLAIFQKTIKSQPSKFDAFLKGNYSALNEQEIYGMHLFRTKGRCMNCHHGKDLTDDSFHNIGLTYYKRQYQDLGRFEITNDPQDVGKFKTPSLRDLLNTRPWMHNGLFDDLLGIVNLYNSGMHMLDPSAEQKQIDPLYPVTDSLMKPLDLTLEERQAIVAFLESLSGSKFKMRRPVLPKDIP